MCRRGDVMYGDVVLHGRQPNEIKRRKGEKKPPLPPHTFAIVRQDKSCRLDLIELPMDRVRRRSPRCSAQNGARQQAPRLSEIARQYQDIAKIYANCRCAAYASGLTGCYSLVLQGYGGIDLGMRPYCTHAKHWHF